MGVDLQRVADSLAYQAYEIATVHRLVIQPDSQLLQYRTALHGYLFVVRGRARMTLNREVYRLQPGSILHVPPGTHIDSIVEGTSELEYYTVMYKPLLCSGGDAWTQDEVFVLEPGELPEIVEKLSLLHQAVRRTDRLRALRAKAIFLTLMEQALTACVLRQQSQQSPHEGIDAVIDYVHSHYMDALTLEGLALRCDMSARQFSYYFHKRTGYRPIDYVIHYRLERARELLMSGHYAIRDVAASVGYANPLYFSRAFKRKYGSAPTSYRER
ncbi:AraC family transcriptional regulator [Paenibacillus sp. 598K]|uniref:AraC family transcriptional regulator n=1 Tax=Paenibacillus sp. 598K TaxID=1117987 RepID=UPI000FFA6FF0|nr:AraC family transcriptional regulator [Paenibacillus sp. 598K]GBF75821.1 AraC family transcriptional regulator [Paenibacillus sp. 598K]